MTVRGWFLSVLIGCSFCVGVQAAPDAGQYRLATFGGGCFWCMEPPFDELKGVISTTSGYGGGHVVRPSYKQVVSGNTGHTEVVQVKYDPTLISYSELLDVYWRNVDPLDDGGQFCDRGHSYRPVIFVHDDQQKQAALHSKKQLNLADENVTAIESFTNFYSAESYHQNYYIKNPVRYKFYRYNCGRDERLIEVWGEKSKS